MQFVIGIDEVGRGPLAGPVAVGAVLLPAALNEWGEWEGLKDSKQLSAKQREAWFSRIEGDARVRWNVSSSSAALINRRGIVAATREAAERALAKLECAPEEASVLLDRGLSVPRAWQQEQFTKGDERIPAIALASIMAKVLRDRHMVALAERYPLYGFDEHKGYGTRMHREAIRMHGPLADIHRTLFIRNIERSLTR